MNILITDSNFYQFLPVKRQHKYDHQKLTAKLVFGKRLQDNYIKIKTNALASPAIFYKRVNHKFCFSDDFQVVVQWCNDNGIELPKGNYFPDIPFKSDWINFHDTQKATYRVDIPAIENYQIVKIYQDGIFTITPPPYKNSTVLFGYSNPLSRI